MRCPSAKDSQVKVVARFTDESFGYDRWTADQVGTGRPGILLLFDTTEARDAVLKERGGEQ